MVQANNTTTLGPRHAETLWAQSELAVPRFSQGDTQGAIALLEIAVPSLEAVEDYRAAGVRANLEQARTAMHLASPELEREPT